MAAPHRLHALPSHTEGSRFLYPRRTYKRPPQSRRTRPKNRLAGRKLAPRVFGKKAAPRARPTLLLVLVWHRENATAPWQLVLGCVVAPDSVTGYVPAPADLIGTRDYYLFRDKNAPDSFKDGKGPNYYIEYGLKFFDAFQVLRARAGNSPQLNKFIDQTKVTLQVALERALAENPSLGNDRQLLLKLAFDTHPDAYRQGGAGHLRIADLLSVTATAWDGIKAYPGSSAMQTIKSTDWIIQAIAIDIWATTSDGMRASSPTVWKYEGFPPPSVRP